MVDPAGLPDTAHFILLINGVPPIPYIWTSWTQLTPESFVIAPVWTDPSTPGDLWSMEQVGQDLFVQSSVTDFLADPWGPITFLNEG